MPPDVQLVLGLWLILFVLVPWTAWMFVKGRRWANEWDARHRGAWSVPAEVERRQWRHEP